MLKQLISAAIILTFLNQKCMFHLFTVEEETYKLLKMIFFLPEIKQRFASAGGTGLALQ
jgi:hypothetical protein